MEKLDIKTPIEDESFGNLGILKTQCKKNNMTIETVEDFIKCNINELYTGHSLRIVQEKRALKGWQDILKYKYLNEPLIADPLLKIKISKNKITYQRSAHDDDLFKCLNRLGFDDTEISFANKLDDCYGGFLKCDGFDKGAGNHYVALKDFKVMDYIEKISENPFHKNVKLAKFYVDYYKNKMNKNNDINNIETLEDMKHEVRSLIEQSKKLDERIETLKEKIEVMENSIEKEPKKNGK